MAGVRKPASDAPAEGASGAVVDVVVDVADDPALDPGAGGAGAGAGGVSPAGSSPGSAEPAVGVLPEERVVDYHGGGSHGLFSDRPAASPHAPWAGL